MSESAAADSAVIVASALHSGNPDRNPDGGAARGKVSRAPCDLGLRSSVTSRVPGAPAGGKEKTKRRTRESEGASEMVLYIPVVAPSHVIA
jgi:hypothetical protein